MNPPYKSPNERRFGTVSVNSPLSLTEGEPVLIDVAAPADKFDELLPKAQKVLLDSVEWKGE